MDDLVTIEKVRDAIQKLKNDGERVTRRNVIAVTGGSMSTVHRLMGQIEDLEARAAATPLGGISETLTRAILEEIELNTRKVATALRDQVSLLQEREKQALEALSSTELRASRLEKDHEKFRGEAGQGRVVLEKNLAVALERVSHLENDLVLCHEERTKSQEAAELARQDVSKLQFQLEQSEQLIGKQDRKIENLESEISKERKALALAELVLKLSFPKSRSVALRTLKGSSFVFLWEWLTTFSMRLMHIRLIYQCPKFTQLLKEALSTLLTTPFLLQTKLRA